jgi:hypothetical protein
MTPSTIAKSNMKKLSTSFQLKGFALLIFTSIIYSFSLNLNTYSLDPEVLQQIITFDRYLTISYLLIYLLDIYIGVSALRLFNEKEWRLVKLFGILMIVNTIIFLASHISYFLIVFNNLDILHKSDVWFIELIFHTIWCSSFYPECNLVPTMLIINWVIAISIILYIISFIVFFFIIRRNFIFSKKIGYSGIFNMIFGYLITILFLMDIIYEYEIFFIISFGLITIGFITIGRCTKKEY